MGSGLAFDGKIKGEDMSEQGLFAREAVSKTSLAYRREPPRAHRADLQAYDASYIISGNRPSEPTSTVHHEPNLIRPSASYILSRAGHLESNVDHWMGNDITEPQDESRHPRREPGAGAQQTSLGSESSGTFANLWYILTLLPMMGAHRRGWCSPRTSIISVLNSVDLFATYIKQVISRARAQVARLAFEQILHECFAVGMDIVLTLHAFIFLVLSIYQASVIH